MQFVRDKLNKSFQGIVSFSHVLKTLFAKLQNTLLLVCLIFAIGYFCFATGYLCLSYNTQYENLYILMNGFIMCSINYCFATFFTELYTCTYQIIHEWIFVVDNNDESAVLIYIQITDVYTV